MKNNSLPLFLLLIISCTNTPQPKIVAELQPEAINPIISFSVDSITAKIIFDKEVKSLDKIIDRATAPIDNSFLIKKVYPAMDDSSISSFSSIISNSNHNKRRYSQIHFDNNRIEMTFTLDTLLSNNHIRSVINKYMQKPPVHYLFDRGGKTPDFMNFANQLLLPIENMNVPKRASRLPNAPRAYRSGIHRGIDFFSNWGTPVRSVADGIVVRSDLNYKEMPADFRLEMLKRSSKLDRTPSDIFNELLLGQAVIIDHGFDLFPGFRSITIYAHLSDIIPKVKVGYEIKAGEIFAFSGNTGTRPSTIGKRDESHLHWELILQDKNGEYYFGQDLEYSKLINALNKLFQP